MSAYSYRTNARESNLPIHPVSSRTSPHSGRHINQRHRHLAPKQPESNLGPNYLEHARPLEQQTSATERSATERSVTEQSSDFSLATHQLAFAPSNVSDKIQSATVQGHFVVESLKVSGDVLMSKINDLVSQGNIHRIVIKNKEGHTLLSVPTTVRAMGSNIESILSTEAIAIDVISAIVPYPKLVVEKFG